jgi:osmotically-inducible protein OsmY
MPRIHTLGIDQAVNEGFLRRLVSLGGGSCDLVESEDRLDEAMNQIHRAIGAPVLTEVHVEAVGCQWIADSLAPSRLPDLFADRPITVYGRFAGDASSFRLRVHGRDAAGRPWHQEVAGRPGPADVLTGLWGRAKVRELEDRYAAGGISDPQALAKQIVEVSLASRVLSRFTAYVAVDRSEVVNLGGQQQKIIQPVEMPAGWDMGRNLRVEVSDQGVLLTGRCTSYYTKQMAQHAAMGVSGTEEVNNCIEVGEMIPKGARARTSEARKRRISEIAADISKAIEAMVAMLADETQRPCDWWSPALEGLMRLLAELFDAVLRQKPAAQPEVVRLLETGRALLADLASRKKDAEDLARLHEYLETVHKTIDAILADQPSSTRRRRFWTGQEGIKVV